MALTLLNGSKMMRPAVSLNQLAFSLLLWLGWQTAAGAQVLLDVAVRQQLIEAVLSEGEDQPEKIEAIYLCNSIQFANNNHFAGFVNLMSSAKAGKMTVEGRFVTWEFLTNFVNMVVTHHWENGLNYLYYEVLYGGYPLVHNSEFLKDYGYYYPIFEPEEGGKAVVRAFENHDKNLDAYRAKAAELIASLSPVAKHNIDLHEKLLWEIK